MSARTTTAGPGELDREWLARAASSIRHPLTRALLVLTSLVLPLIAAAGLALATWLVYVPAARRGATGSGHA